MNAGVKPQPLNTNTHEHRKLVDDAVARIKRVTLLPEVTLRIVELIRQDDYTADALEKLVSTDPALCLRILKVINSAFYGAPKSISSIRHALVVLGSAAVQNIALATSLGRVFQSDAMLGDVSARHLWRHSLAVAAGSKLLTVRAQPRQADEAFLAGLLHDTGFIVQMQSDNGVYAQMAPKSRAERYPSLELEIESFGADHQEFGTCLSDAWGLPGRLSQVIAAHHAPMACPDEMRLIACAVNIADVAAQKHSLGFTLDATDHDYDGEALDALSQSEDGLEEFASAMAQATEELVQVLE